MSQMCGIVRRSSSGANVIQFPAQPTQCVAATDPWPRAARSRRGSTSAAYRISQIVQVVVRADGEADAPATETVRGE